MKELQTQTTLLTLINSLRPGPCKDSLLKKPARIMDEIQECIEKYIYLEETRATTIDSSHMSRIQEARVSLKR